MSERQKSFLSVVFALGSCLAYVIAADIIEIRWEEEDADEDDPDEEETLNGSAE
jgi:hypothetical protein